MFGEMAVIEQYLKDPTTTRESIASAIKITCQSQFDCQNRFGVAARLLQDPRSDSVNVFEERLEHGDVSFDLYPAYITRYLMKDMRVMFSSLEDASLRQQRQKWYTKRIIKFRTLHNELITTVELHTMPKSCRL